MKKLFLTLTFALVAFAASAQTYFSFAQPELMVNKTMVDGVNYDQLVAEGYMPSAAIGSPSLPTTSQMIQIPVCSDVRVEIINALYDTIDGASMGIHNTLLPTQASLSKSDRTHHRLYFDPKAYNTNAFCGVDPVTVEIAGIARDRNLATIYYSPVRYNPVTNQLIVCSKIDVRLVYVNEDQEATRDLAKYAVNAAPVRYLIVSHSSFRGQFDELIAWKKRKGFMAEVVYTDDPAVGNTTTSISNYLKGLYTNATPANPAPTYVILAGDVAQIPAFSSHLSGEDHYTDLYYFTWTTGDNLPDCYYGRFSAQNVEQLKPQIDKTLMYEQYTFPDPSFLGKAVLVAGVDGGYSSDHGYQYGDPTMDFVARNYVNGNQGYTQVKYFKNNSSVNPNAPNVTVASNGNASTVCAAYNEGVGLINYTAHGDWDEFSIPAFTVSNVNSMTNVNKFGLVIGNCCLTNKFDKDCCFGESWLRKGNYCGAVGYIGGSNVTYWNEDVYWSMGVRTTISATMSTDYNPSNLGMYDRLFHLHNESVNEWYITQGSIIYSGNLAVQASTSSMKQYYWEIYHLMGDPSIMPYLAEPGVAQVSAPSATVSGVPTLSVTAPAYAYVALTAADGTLVCAAFADATGAATLDMTGVNPGAHEISVWAQKYQPFFQTLTVAPPSGPYLTINDVTSNGIFAPGDTVSFDMTIANIGNWGAWATSLTASVDNQQLLLLNNSVNSGDYQAGDQQTFHAIFPARVWEGVNDGDDIPVTFTINWTLDNNANSNTITRHYTAVAPVVSAVRTNINTINPGDNASLVFNLSNTGHRDLVNATATLMPNFPLATVGNNVPITSLNAGASTTATFNVAFDASLIDNSLLPFTLTIAGDGYTQSIPVEVHIGQSTIETFESGNFTSFPWSNSSNKPWQITSTGVHTGTYCARSYQNTGSQGTSQMSITVNVSHPDSISFYYKVSSESGYDKFKFYLDGVQKLEASGEEGWTRVAYAVATGNHTLEFVYSKDWSVNSGSDCAWIDDVKFPGNEVSCTFESDSVCQNSGDYAYHGQQLSTATVGVQTAHVEEQGSHYYMALTVVEQPDVAITASSTTIAQGSNVILTASGADSYLWSNGATTSSISVSPESLGEQTYTVTGYRGSCSDEASITLNVVLGVDAPRAGMHVSVYPNPAHNTVTVASENAVKVEFYDMMGKCVKSLNNVSNLQQINIQSLQAGVYFVRVSGSDASASTKLIVK